MSISRLPDHAALPYHLDEQIIETVSVKTTLLEPQGLEDILSFQQLLRHSLLSWENQVHLPPVGKKKSYPSTQGW
jgi:hypothetical protein